MNNSASKAPPRVSRLQWSLTICIFALGGLAYLSPTYEDVRTTLVAIVLLNIFLTIILVVETLRTKVIGKLLLTSATLAFYWLEAVQISSSSPPFLAPTEFQYSSPQFRLDIVRISVLYVALFQLMLFAGYSIHPRLGSLVSFARSRYDRGGGRAFITKYLLGACIWVPLVASFGFGVTPIFDNLVESRRGIGGTSVQGIGFLHYLTFFGLFGAAYLLTEGLLFPGKSRKLHFLLGALSAAPVVMLGGSRHLWLVVAMPIVVLGLARSAGRLTTAKLATWGALVVVVLLVLNLQLAVRDKGWDKISDVRTAEILQGSSSGQFTALLHAIYLVPDKHDYFLRPAEPYFIVHWIPRPVWHDKPVLPIYTYYNQNYAKSGAFNVTPSLLGQYHMTWGALGIIAMGLWLGFLVYAADRLLLNIDLSNHLAMGVAIGGLYAFVANSYRIYSPTYFTYFAFGVVGMLLLTRGKLGAEKSVQSQSEKLSVRPSLKVQPHA